MNTPDTEWQKELRDRFLGRPVTPTIDQLEVFIASLLTSRDTYWKERVAVEKDRYKKFLQHHYKHYGIESVKELITNKDNLK